MLHPPLQVLLLQQQQQQQQRQLQRPNKQQKLRKTRFQQQPHQNHQHLQHNQHPNQFQRRVRSSSILLLQQLFPSLQLIPMYENIYELIADFYSDSFLQNNPQITSTTPETSFTWLYIVIAVVLLLLCGAIVGYFVVKKRNNQETDSRELAQSVKGLLH
jgi:hypothetical protein